MRRLTSLLAATVGVLVCVTPAALAEDHQGSVRHPVSVEPAAPTSVRLAVPGTTRTRSLSYTTPEYEALALQVGAREPPESVSGGPGVDAIRSVGVTLTWLHHRVEPWRVDRVWLTPDDGVWISTRVSDLARSVREAPQRWHRPDAPMELVTLLEHLGVASAAKGGGRLFPEAARGITADAAELRPAAPAASPPDVWALVAAGAGVLLLAGVLGGRRRSTQPEEDGVPGPGDELPPEAERLSWGPGTRR